MAEQQKDETFEQKLAREEAEGRKERLEGSPPIGMKPDGTLNIRAPGEPAPKFEPEIIGEDNDPAPAR